MRRCALRSVVVGAAIAGAIAGLALAGCSVVSPPPIAPVHATPAPQTEGTLTVSIAVGLAIGIFVDPGAGAELRVEWQDRATRAFGIGLAGGANFRRRCLGPDRRREPANRVTFRVDRHCGPRWLFAVRAYRVFHLEEDLEHIALHAGFGLGFAEGGLLYATADGAVRFGTNQGTVDVYMAPAVSLSVPILRGRPIIESGERQGLRPSPSIHGGWELGVVFADGERGGGSIAGAWALGYALSGDLATHFAASAAGHLAVDAGDQ